MTDRAALLMDLAEKCEKAQGPDRELDLGIARAIGWEQDPKQPQFWRHTSTPNVRQMFEPPRYTASLDAALSLVPEGWAWAVYGGAREEIVATAYCVPNGGRLPWPDWVTDICAATPALALCAAALRALALEVGQ